MISNSGIRNALADCLKRIEAGSPPDQVLADYPHLAGQLRELLSTAQEAQQAGKTVRVPASAQIDSRRRLLAQAQELKKKEKDNFFWPLIRYFRQNAGTMVAGLAAFTLLLVALSSTRALPGDSLYPVKIVAEQAGSSVYVGSSSQMQREEGFDNRRTSEINQMILERRTGPVQFAGFLDHSEVSGWQIAGVSLGISNTLEKQSLALLGAYVDINGFLDSKGVVEVNMIQPRLMTIRGTLKSIQENIWQVDNSSVVITDFALVTGTPRVGSPLIVQAARMHGSSQVLAISVKVNSAGSLGTTEPIETTPQATVTPSSTPLPTTPVTINTPQPQDDPHPEDPQPQPTKKGEHEDDSHKKGGEDSERED
jgi:hypothetical protein